MRLTPEIVIAAYKKTGRKVCQGHWTFGKSTCALGALALANGATDGQIAPAVNVLMKGSPSGYVSGFIGGFDGDEIDTTDDETGYADGVAAYKACEAEGLCIT